MRLNEDIICCDKPRVYLWLVLEHIETCTCKMLALQSFNKCFFINDRTTSGIDKLCALLEHCKLFRRKEVSSSGTERNVYRDDITLAEEVTKISDIFGAMLSYTSKLSQ